MTVIEYGWLAWISTKTKKTKSKDRKVKMISLASSLCNRCAIRSGADDGWQMQALTIRMQRNIDETDSTHIFANNNKIKPQNFYIPSRTRRQIARHFWKYFIKICFMLSVVYDIPTALLDAFSLLLHFVLNIFKGFCCNCHRVVPNSALRYSNCTALTH